MRCFAVATVFSSRWIESARVAGGVAGGFLRFVLCFAVMVISRELGSLSFDKFGAARDALAWGHSGNFLHDC